MFSVLFLIAALAADAPKATELPKAPAAVQAKKVYDQQLKWAQAQFDQASAKARTDYLASLKASLQLALRGGNLEESNRIDAEMKAVQEGAAKPKDDKDEPFSLVGKWDFRYNNGTVNERIIGKDGKVEGGGTVKKVGKDTIIDWGTVIERITPAGDRLFVEHYHPSSDYGRKVAATMGEGVRK
jgi:hypothetical protein